MELEKLFQQAEQMRVEERLDGAIPLYQKTEEQAVAESNEWYAAESLHMVGLVHYQRGEYKEAEAAYKFAEGRFRDLKRNDMVGAVLRDLGILALKRDNYNKAQGYLEESIKILENAENKGHLGISQVKLGRVLAEIERADEGETLIYEGIKNIKKSPERFFESTAYYDLARVQRMVGKTKEAKVSAVTAVKILDAISTQEQFQTRRQEIMKFLEDL